MQLLNPLRLLAAARQCTFTATKRMMLAGTYRIVIEVQQVLSCPHWA
jgi:hypothetical protein